MDQGLRQDLVSIVIPAYNAAHLLGETLESVLQTQYEALEVIVVNDGSKDDTLAVARQWAEKDGRLRVIDQPNQGPAAARNHAISEAHGVYILPVDADDLIEPTFVGDAVAVLAARPEVMVVEPKGDFFGERHGEWRLPEFSRHLLARKNHIPACAMYRRKDWLRIGGYCTEMPAREDWDFWIAMLKDGGEVVMLPYVAFHYRVSHGSKRFADRKHDKEAISMLNQRHPEFFRRELGGPLRRMRSWSKIINRLLCVNSKQ